MIFIVLDDEIWSSKIHRPKFVTTAFPPLARNQFQTHRLIQQAAVDPPDLKVEVAD